MFVTAIIAAAGRGERFGVGLKQLLSIDGRTILDRSVRAYLTHPSVDEVVVALPEELVADPPAYLRDAGKPLHLVAGGRRGPGPGGQAVRGGAAGQGGGGLPRAAAGGCRAGRGARRGGEGVAGRGRDRRGDARRAGRPHGADRR